MDMKNVVLQPPLEGGANILKKPDSGSLASRIKILSINKAELYRHPRCNKLSESGSANQLRKVPPENKDQIYTEAILSVDDEKVITESSIFQDLLGSSGAIPVAHHSIERVNNKEFQKNFESFSA